MNWEEWQTPTINARSTLNMSPESEHFDSDQLEEEDSESNEVEESPEPGPTFRQRVEDVINQEEVLVVGDGVAVLTTPDDSVLLHPLPSPCQTSRLLPFSVAIFPWLALTAADREVLADTLRSLSGDADGRLASLNTTHNVLLMDFPPEVLLQRPALVKCLVRCLGDAVWQIQLAALRCLALLTWSLHQRLQDALRPESSAAGATLLQSEFCPAGCEKRFRFRTHQTLESQVEHPFSTVPSDPTTDAAQSLELSLHQLSVQQFAALLLHSPLPTQSLFGSSRPVLRTAAADVMRALLAVLDDSVNVAAMWQAWAERQGGEELANGVSRPVGGDPSCSGGAESDDGRGVNGAGGARTLASGNSVNSGQHFPMNGVWNGCPLQTFDGGGDACNSRQTCCNGGACSYGGRLSPTRCDDNFEAVSDLIMAIKQGLHEASCCLVASHEERWLCAGAVQLRQQCALLAQAAATLTDWLHALTAPLPHSAYLLTDSTAEAVVLMVCDITSILRLLPPLTPGAESPAPPKAIVTLFSLLGEVDALANSQVSAILSTCAALQSCVQFMQCSSRALSVFLALSRAALPSLPLHCSPVFVDKLLEGLCKQHPSADNGHQRNIRMLLLELLCFPHPQTRAAVMSSLRALVLRTLGTLAAATRPSRQQRQQHCLLLLHRAPLTALLHCTAHPLQAVSGIAEEVLVLLLSSEQTMGPGLWRQLCRSCCQVLPQLQLLADSVPLAAALHRLPQSMLRAVQGRPGGEGPDTDDSWLLNLVFLCDLQGLFHKSVSVRGHSFPRVLHALSSTRSLLQVPSQEALEATTQEVGEGAADLLLVAPVSLCPDYRHVQLQPEQVIRLVELLDHCGRTPRDGSTASAPHSTASNTSDGSHHSTSTRSLSMVGAVWRQLSYLSQHPGHHSVLLSLTMLQYYTVALREMMQVDGSSRGFTLSEAGSCLELLRHLSLHQPSCRSALAKDGELLRLVARAVLLSCGDMYTRRQGALLLFMLLLEPFVHYPDQQRTEATHCEGPLHGVADDSRLGRNSSSHGDELMLPSVPKLVHDKLHVPFHCSIGVPEDVRDHLDLYRRFLESVLPKDILLEDESPVSNICLKEEIVLRNDLDEACGNTFKTMELLVQAGGCSEQIHALLKMVWALCAAGGALKVRGDVDYSSNFSDFFKMDDREKLLFDCALNEHFMKNLLRDIENGTSFHEVKANLCLVENCVNVAMQSTDVRPNASVGLLPTESVPSAALTELLLSDLWWRALKRFLTREPSTTGEQQTFTHVLAVLCLVLKGLAVIARPRDGCLHERVLQCVMLRELHVPLQLPHSPICSTLSSTGSREFGQQGNSGEDQVAFRVFTGLCSLLRMLATLPPLSTPDRPLQDDANDPHQGRDRPLGGLSPVEVEASGVAACMALGVVLESACQRNAFSLGVLRAAASCLASLAGHGWLRQPSAATTTVRHCARLLLALADGRGGSGDTFLGRGATLACATALSRTLAHLPHTTQVLSQLFIAGNHADSSTSSHKNSTNILMSSSPRLSWLPSLLSHRDCSVRCSGWVSLASVASTAGGLRCLLQSLEGSADLWPAMMMCICSLSRPTSERTASVHLLAHVLARFPSMTPPTNASPLPPVVTDTLTGESVNGVEGVLVLLEHHCFYGSVVSTLSAGGAAATSREPGSPHHPCLATPPRLVSALFLLLTNLVALRPADTARRLVREGVPDLVVGQLKRFSNDLLGVPSASSGPTSPGDSSPQNVQPATCCAAVQRGAALLVAVLRSQSRLVLTLARDSSLPNTLVAVLSSKDFWPGDATVTSCLELLGWLVDTRLLPDSIADYADHGAGVTPRDGAEDQPTDQLWGCLRVMAVVQANPEPFFATLIRALHISSPDGAHQKAGEEACYSNHFRCEPSSSSPYIKASHCSHCGVGSSGVKSTSLSTAKLSQAAASFLSLFIHGLIEHCDQAPNSDHPSLHHLSNILATPAVLVASKSVCPGFELCRHLIHVATRCYSPHSLYKPPSILKRNENNLQSGKSNKRNVDDSKRPTGGRSTPSPHPAPPLNNGSVSHLSDSDADLRTSPPPDRQEAECQECLRNLSAKASARPEGPPKHPDSLEPLYLECLAMLAFVCRSARYACHHLSKILLPPLIRPIDQLPQLLFEKRVHFTANLMNGKEVSGPVLEVCRSLRLLTNIVCERGDGGDYRNRRQEGGGLPEEDGALVLSEAVLPLLHQLWLPALHTPFLLHHCLVFVVTATQHTHVCPLLLRTSSLPGSLLSAQRSNRPLLACIAHIASQNIAAANRRASALTNSGRGNSNNRASFSGRQTVGGRQRQAQQHRQLQQQRCSVGGQQQPSPSSSSSSSEAGATSSPRYLAPPSLIRGANTTLLGGAIGLENHSTYLALCVLANTARLPECAALIAKSGLVAALLECVGGGGRCPEVSSLAAAAIKLLTVLALHSTVHSLILKCPGWLSCLHRCLHLPPAPQSPGLCLHTLRLLVSLVAVPAALQAMLANEEFLCGVVRALSQRCSGGGSRALTSFLTTGSGDRMLLVFLWAIAASGHRAQSALRQLAVVPLLRHIDVQLAGACAVTRVLLEALDGEG